MEKLIIIKQQDDNFTEWLKGLLKSNNVQFSELLIDQSIEKRCEQTFLNKFGNKISAGESWVVRYAIDCATEQDIISKAKLLDLINFYNAADHREYGCYKPQTMDGSERDHNNTVTKKIIDDFFNQFTNR